MWRSGWRRTSIWFIRADALLPLFGACVCWCTLTKPLGKSMSKAETTWRKAFIVGSAYRVGAGILSGICVGGKRRN